MKTTKKLILGIIVIFFLSACANIAKFPISSVTPAAVITAKMKKDKNNNYAIIVTANNLASAERLTPPKKTYVVWIETKENGVKNIGQFKIKNASKSTLETLSAARPIYIFITAEAEGDVAFPAGIEISRTNF